VAVRRKQLLIALDQLANTLLGGWADETLSSRAYRRGWAAARWIDALFFWETEHCAASYRAERQRLQLPPEFR
jgi:hypothetical protein